jgi:hypothetical protein
MVVRICIITSSIQNSGATSMYGSHESSQYAVVFSEDDGKETEFQLTVNCVTLGYHGCRYLSNGDPGDPPEAAEFELDSVHVLDDDGNPIPLTYQILEAVVSKELAQKMYDNAVTEALESGDF